MKPLVVVGAGLAGWTLVRELRKLAPDPLATPISLVTADSGDFYAKPSLSNAFAQGKAPAQLITTAAGAMAASQKVELVAGTRLLAIDTAARVVQTSSGPLAYSRLVLATGAQPIRPALQGDASEQVLAVNTLEDFARFHGRLSMANMAASHHETSGDSYQNRSKHVLILGAGLIGCEFANDLAQAGYRVTVVDPGTRALAALLPAQASSRLQAALETCGVKFLWGLTVQAVNHQAGGLQAGLSDGSTLAADVVLSAIGLRADTRIAQAAGICCERGIRVDGYLQTSAPGVYALGDSAQYAHGVTMPYVMPIMAAARALAATLAGQDTAVVFPVMPVSVKTPTLPVLVAPPPLATPGEWRGAEDGLWQFFDTEGRQRGFTLTGKGTARRAEQLRALEGHSA